MEDVPWYSDATLFTETRVRRAGTLVQCIRKWDALSDDEKHNAHIKLSVQVDGLLRLDAVQILALMSHPGYIKA